SSPVETGRSSGVAGVIPCRVDARRGVGNASPRAAPRCGTGRPTRVGGRPRRRGPAPLCARRAHRAQGRLRGSARVSRTPRGAPRGRCFKTRSRVAGSVVVRKVWVATPDPKLPFSDPTAQWFTRAFAAPTEAQAQAWKSIHGSAHTLVVAPTGSGKTLAAFL